MKYLLLLLVVLVAVAWLSIGRRRRNGSPPAGPASRREPAAPTMIACAHCGVHLPQSDALFDAAGRPYCSDAHRLAGPR